MREPDWDAYPHFNRHEFECRCGCGRADMSPLLLAILESVRTVYERPIRISSGFRCPDHNDAVSSTGRDGPHTTGLACDIAVSGEDARRLLQCIAPRIAISGIGISQKGPHEKRFIHIDLLRNPVDDEPGPPRPWLWSY